MLLNEIYNWDHGVDLTDHARRVLDRLEKTGARDAGHGPEMNELRDLIAEYEDERQDPEAAKRMVNGGSETAVGYIAKQIHNAIDHLGHQVRATGGSGALNKKNREDLDTAQRADPQSREIRSARKELGESASKGSTSGDKIAR